MNIIKLFFAFVLAFIGLLLLPFVVMGGPLSGVFGALLVLALGGGTLYIIYLLWTDRFAALSAREEQKVKQVALLCSLLGILGQVGMRLGFGVSGTALYSEFLMGSLEVGVLEILCFLLTAAASAVSILPIYLRATAQMDFSYHDYVIVTQSNGLEVKREYGSSSMERPLLTMVALMTAVLGILSTHVLLLFLILGTNLALFMPTERAARLTRILSTVAGVLAFLATFGGVGYEMDDIVKALDILPILLFFVVKLALWLYDEGRIYTPGLAAIFFGSFFPAWILSLLPFLALPEFSLFGLLAPVGLYAVIGFLILAVVLSVRAYRSIAGALRTVGRHTAPFIRRWVALLLAVVLLSLLLLSVVFDLFLTLGTPSLFSGEFFKNLFARGPEIAYELHEDATFEVGGVRYGLSNRGVIALSVVDPDAETVTLSGFTEDGYDTATSRAAELLEGAPSAYINKVYAVAEGFLSGNETVKTLILPAGLSLAFFAEDAITDCPSLESIRLYHTVDRAVGDGLSAFSSSFPSGVRLEVGDLDRTADYSRAFRKVGDRLVYLQDVYLCAAVSVSWFRYGDYNGKTEFDSASGSLSVRGNIYGRKSVSHSFRFSGLSESDEVLVFHAGDPVKCRENGSKMKAEYSVSGRVKLSAWILNAYSSFGGAGTIEAPEGSFRISEERSHRGSEDTACDVAVATYLIYRAPKK